MGLTTERRQAPATEAELRAAFDRCRGQAPGWTFERAMDTTALSFTLGQLALAMRNTQRTPVQARLI